MKFVRLGLAAIFFVFFAEGFSQTCSTGTGVNQNFFTFCNAGPAPITLANYTLDLANNSTLFFNGNVTFTGTLTINLGGGDSNVQVNSGFTLTAANITFTGSSGNGKNLIVNGALVVSGTIAFDSGQPIELDGTGTISAGSITGSNLITCTATGGCPIISTGSCAPAGSGLCLSLPIELLFFKTQREGNSISLIWATASELNFDFFEVEKSANGVDFKFLSSVPGHGTTHERHDYQTTDRNPSIGNNYYRLKAVDFDGYTEYFDMVMIDYHSTKQFQIYPNPGAGDQLKISINFSPSDNSIITIVNQMGFEVARHSITSAESHLNFINPLAPGIYVARISSKGFSEIERFIVK